MIVGILKGAGLMSQTSTACTPAACCSTVRVQAAVSPNITLASSAGQHHLPSSLTAKVFKKAAITGVGQPQFDLS